MTTQAQTTCQLCGRKSANLGLIKWIDWDEDGTLCRVPVHSICQRTSNLTYSKEVSGWDAVKHIRLRTIGR